MGGYQPVSVTGGVGGISAHCDEIRSMAGHFGRTATHALGAAWTLHGYLVHPAVLESAIVDPVGFARFEDDLLSALDGMHGLTWAGGRCGLIDGELRAAATAYEDADRLVTTMRDDVLGALREPAALAAGAATLARTGSITRAAQSVLATDPETADTVIDTLDLPALITGLDATLPDGHGVATGLGLDTSGPAGVPPRHLSDVLRDLEQRNDDPRHGAIDVRILTLADGSRRVIVDITGTKDWSPGPTDDVTSLTTNGRSLLGESTAYEQGVLQAMRQAGVRPDDDVMIVGHSEGGMVAVTTARDALASGEFRVTHVVTAGSPIGRTVGELPSSVQVLALENTRDLVPHLDGVANPDRPTVTTVRSAHGDGQVEDDHSLDDAYVPLATDAEHSHDASIRYFLRSARDYFRGTHVRTHAFQITRSYR
jgi:hypothetical protein